MIALEVYVMACLTLHGHLLSLVAGQLFCRHQHAMPCSPALSRSHNVQEAVTKASVQRQRQSPVSPLHQHLAEGSAGDTGEHVFRAPMLLSIACS